MGERESYVPSEEVERRHNMESEEGERQAEGARRGLIDGFEVMLEELEALADRELPPSDRPAREVEKERDQELENIEKQRQEELESMKNLMLDVEKIEEGMKGRELSKETQQQIARADQEWHELSEVIQPYVEQRPKLLNEWSTILTELSAEASAAEVGKDPARIIEGMQRANEEARSFAMTHLPKEMLVQLHLIDKSELVEKQFESLDELKEHFDEKIGEANTLVRNVGGGALRELKDLVKRELKPRYSFAKKLANKEPWHLGYFYESAIKQLDAFLSKYQSKE